MSPIGGVGINLAIQDAVATAPTCSPPKLRSGYPCRLTTFGAVQRRRESAARLTQALQLFIQRRIYLQAADGRAPLLKGLPAVVRWLPFLPRIPGV